MSKRWVANIVFAVACLGSSLAGAEGPLNGFERFVQPDGSFTFPGASAREGLVHLGSWYAPEGDARGFHHVYTQPESLAAYRASGEFPDGAVLLKEIRRATKANYTTGVDVASAAEIVQWFLMVKDRMGRYPGHPLWREGWGWALFKGDAPKVNAAKAFETDCQGCHTPARATDWVYKNAYPR